MSKKVTGYRLQVIVISLLFLLFPVTCAMFSISAHSEIHTVVMVEGGFEPQTITIDENQTVLFFNKDKVERWPASDIHPTHELYPEFDPQKGVKVGESWSFRPKRAGTFKYHDHLFPHFRGTLIVEEEAGLEPTPNESSKPATSWMDGVKKFFSDLVIKVQSLFSKKQTNVLGTRDLSKLSPKEQIEALTEITKKDGADKVWEFLLQTFKGQSGSSGNIHDLAHLIGTLVYADRGFNGITICSPEFAFGCYHGFLDKAFEKSLADLNKAEQACGSLGQGGPFASCIHGIGHGVASFYQTSNINDSLNSCQKLTQGKDFCFDGVFMEYERSALQDFYSRDNPYEPCNSLERQFGPIYSFACGRNQPTVLMSRFQFSFDDVIRVCLGSSSKAFKDACFDTLGFITVRSVNNAEGIIDACRKIGVDEYILRCAKAAAGELIFQEMPNWQENAPKVCLSLSAQFQVECQQYIDNIVREYSR